MKHFFNNALTIYDVSGRDEYGRESWGDGTAVTGRFVEKHRLFYNPKGEAVTTDAHIDVPSDTTIDIGSRVGYDSKDYRVIKIKKPKDHKHIKFIKAFLQRIDDV